MTRTKSTPRKDSTASLGFEARLWLTLLTALVLAPLAALRAADKPPGPATTAEVDLALNYHLMHPGGGSLPGDPNAAFEIRISNADRTRMFWTDPADMRRARERAVPTGIFAWP